MKQLGNSYTASAALQSILTLVALNNRQYRLSRGMNAVTLSYRYSGDYPTCKTNMSTSWTKRALLGI